MTLREITIGRAKDSDIYLDDRCIYASTNHATIYYDGGQLMFRDRSRNGTSINNIMVKGRAVPIHYGDSIMIARTYPISWEQINRFFPVGTSRANVVRQNSVASYQSPVQQAIRAVEEEKPVDLSKWNWGAFSLYGLWGFFNGCWWAFLISLFFGWSFIPNIIFGVYGTRWAWENREWSSVQDFEETQKGWAAWGIGILIVSLLVAFFSIMSIMVILS